MVTGLGFAPVTPMHTARAYGAAVTLADGTVLVAGGGVVTREPFDAELYDDQKQTWTGSVMTTGRTGNTATLLPTGQVLVIGGDTSGNPNTAEVYTPGANSWEKISNNLHYARTAHTATLLPDGRVLVTGGLTIFGPTLNTAEIFDPGSDPVDGSWTVVNPMNDGRAYHTATLLPTGMVLVAGGSTDSRDSLDTALPSAELFDPGTGIWTRTSPMNERHSGHTATLLDFQLVVRGDFVVLIAGGIDEFGSISTAAELYQPPPLVIESSLPAGGQPLASNSTGSWVNASPMNVSRMFHTATALPVTGGPRNRDRQVLVTGGPDPGDEVTSGQTTEVYDLATGSWMLTGNMQSDRTGHTAALLSGGRVLLAGGLGGTYDTTTVPLQSAEVGTICDASAQIIVSPTQTMDFGQVRAGWADNNSNFLPIVQNTGNAELTLGATISGPDAALFDDSFGKFKFNLAVGGTGLCTAGPTGGNGSEQVFVQFNAWSPVPKTCSATLTLSDSNATNAAPGQRWVFPMTAQIILSPGDVVFDVTAPAFPQTIAVGEAELGQLIITLVSQVAEAVSGIARFPPPPPQSAFLWTAGDYMVGTSERTVSVTIEFRPLVAGSVTQTLELITNMQADPLVIPLRATAR